MLTTGVKLHANQNAQRTLIDELDRAHVAALGFGVEVVCKEVPSALLQAARERGFPIFEIPLQTPFREVIASVNRALVGGELRTYQRIWSMQRYLLDALVDDDPRGAVVQRLASLLEATVLVLAPDGGIEVATARAPVDLLWPEIAARQQSLIIELKVDDWRAVAAAIVTPGGGRPRWLVVASQRPGFPIRIAKAAAQAAAPLLGAVARLGELGREQEQAVRSALLQDALSGTDASSSHLAARAASLGLDLAEPVRVALVAPIPRTQLNPSRSPDLRAVASAVARALEDADLPHLMTSNPAAVIVLAQAPAGELHERLRALVAASADIQAGIGRAVENIADVRHSYRDAELALDHATGTSGGVAEFEDLDLGTLLFREVPEDRLRPKLDECLAPLRAHPELLATLAAYFAHDLDVLATAHHLHLHPNTLRYRLGRIEKLLGRSLKQPATIAALHIALQATPRDGAGAQLR